jgi:hypothetical protein
VKDIEIHRVVDDIDGVTFVPPPLLGYEHVGEVRHLFEDPEPPLLIHAEKVGYCQSAPHEGTNRLAPPIPPSPRRLQSPSNQP